MKIGAYPFIAALVFSSASASAETPCAVIGSILSEDSNALNGVGMTIGADGLVSLTQNGQTSIVSGADACELSSPNDGLDITCDWSFEKDQSKKAQAYFDTLKGQLEGCLPEPLIKQAPRQYSAENLAELRGKYGQSYADYVSKLKDLHNFKLTIEGAADDDLTIGLRMKRNGQTDRTSISLTFYRL